MFRRLRFLIALFAALALPLQAAAGVVMPFAALGDGAPAAMASAMDEAAMPEDCPMRQQSAPAADHGTDCSHCGFCHLAGAGFLPCGEALAPVAAFAHVLAPSYEAAPSDHIPEPPQQPPRRSV